MSNESFYVSNQDALGDLRSLVESMPYARHLGLRAERGEDGNPRFCLPYRDSLIGNMTLPALHGGTLAALIEFSAVFSAQALDERWRRPKLIDSTVDYLRSAKAVDTFAAATLLRQGRRVMAVRVDCWQSEIQAPVASGRVHLLLASDAE